MDRFLAAARHGDILGDIPTVPQLYEQGAASVQEADRDRMIALALATHVGRDTIVELKKHGSNIGLGKESHLFAFSQHQSHNLQSQRRKWRGYDLPP
jgi:hypothetical protein